MSLVGTRPPTVDEYEQYEIGHRKRLHLQFYKLYLTVNNSYFPLGLTFSDNTEFLSRS